MPPSEAKRRVSKRMPALAAVPLLGAIVAAGPAAAECSSRTFYVDQLRGGDRGLYVDGRQFDYRPGDRFVLRAAASPYSYLALQYVAGTAECPVTIVNEGGVARMTSGIDVADSRHVHVTGAGSADAYGIDVGDPGRGGVGVHVHGRSDHVEIDHVYVHDKTYGFWVKHEADCDPAYQYPNWVIDAIDIHDNRIENMGQEGMYLGSTDPNGTRPVTCGGVTITPRPLRLGNIRVSGNRVDRTNRSGIQLSGADHGHNEIDHNHVTNAGYELNDQQGNGIVLGGYTHAEVHHNTIDNTFTLGIFTLGSGYTSIHDNAISRSGLLSDPPVPGIDGILVDTRRTEPVERTLVDIRDNRISDVTGYGVRFYKTFDTYDRPNVVCGNDLDVSVAAGIEWIDACDILLRDGYDYLR